LFGNNIDFEAVIGIRDIFRSYPDPRIRTFFRTDPGPNPALPASDLQDAKEKQFFSFTFLCLFLFEGTFTSFLKDKKSYRDRMFLGLQDPDPLVNPDPSLF
jgi:hypothetical protein